MAIGSNPEIGTKFGLLKDMTIEEIEEWWDYVRREWHPYLMKGYATLVHDLTNNPFYGEDHGK